MEHTATLPEQYPAVDRAYEFVQPSYQLLAQRFESADTRLVNMATIACTLMLGLPVLGRAMRPDLSFAALPFVLAVASLTAASTLGIVGRLRGALTLVDPGVLYRKSLHESEWEFKKNAVFFAGQHFEANAAAIHEKRLIAVVMSAAMLGALLSAVIWLAR
jgi:hypothetical protein